MDFSPFPPDLTPPGTPTLEYNLNCSMFSISRVYLAGPARRGTWMTGLRGEGPRLLQQAAQLALLLQRGEARSA